MPKSMTGYGRGSAPYSGGSLVVEVQSVNRKMLDFALNIPKEFLRFDIEMRKALSCALERGQVSVRVTVRQEEGIGGIASLEGLKRAQKDWEKVAQALGYDPKKVVDFSFLVQQGQAVREVDVEEEAARKALFSALDAAIQELVKMKSKEGVSLAKDLQMRLALVENYVQAIEARGQGIVDRYREKLTARLQEVAQMQECDPRLLHEIALYAEKIDVTEEIVRLRSHLKQCAQLFKPSDKSVGRTLEFLTQEMQREANTIASKSAEAEVSSLVVSMKSELEKIREQVQNIE